MALPANIDIAPLGDVLLICGLGEEQKRRRVSSAALREASPVFDALIGRRLQQEGTNPSVPIALALPVHKNGSHAMELICNALHKRPEALPQSLDRQLLKSVWSLCDKYKITRRLMQVMMFSWLGNAIKSLDNVSNDTVLLVELLGGSLYFGLTEHISRLGLLLVKTTTGSLMLHSPRLPRAVSDPLARLEKIREDLKEDLLGSVEHQIRRQGNPNPSNYVSCHGCCEYAKKNVADFASHLASWNMWPPEFVKETSLAKTYLMFRHTETDDHQAKNERMTCALYCTMWMVGSFKSTCAELLSKSVESEKNLDRLKFDPTVEDGSAMKGFGLLPLQCSV